MFAQIDLANIKGVLLDCDDTLYEYAPCSRYANECCFEELKEMGRLKTFEEYKILYKNAQVAVKKYLPNQGSGHSRFLYFQRFFETLDVHTNFDLTIYFEKIYWDNFFTKMVLRAGALEFLQKLRERKVKVCIVTDLTAKVQFEKICHLGITSYIDFVVSSEEAGQEKPARPIYDLALEKLEMDYSEVIMVGDGNLFSKDSVGAEALGIRSIQVV